jgi:hypothetical protein
LLWSQSKNKVVISFHFDTIGPVSDSTNVSNVTVTGMRLSKSLDG